MEESSVGVAVRVAVRVVGEGVVPHVRRPVGGVGEPERDGAQRTDEVLDPAILLLTARDVAVHGLVHRHVKRRGQHGVEDESDPQRDDPHRAEHQHRHPGDGAQHEGRHDAGLEASPERRRQGALRCQRSLSLGGGRRRRAAVSTELVDGEVLGEWGGVSHRLRSVAKAREIGAPDLASRPRD